MHWDHDPMAIPSPVLRTPSPTVGEYPFSVPSASCRHNETMRGANNTPNQSVAADVSRLKLDPRPARNGRLGNRSDPAHAGCYKREWKSTRATGQGAIAGSTIGVAFKPMLNRYWDVARALPPAGMYPAPLALNTCPESCRQIVPSRIVCLEIDGRIVA